MSRTYIVTLLRNGIDGRPLRTSVPYDNLDRALQDIDYDRKLCAAQGQPEPRLSLRSVPVRVPA